MLVLKLCKQLCPERIPFAAGAKLGDGADGEVFDIAGKSDRVIKYCVLYEAENITLDDSYKSISRVIDYLIGHNLPAYAHVYAHSLMGQFSRDAWKNTKQRYILYYYVMEKLLKISEDELKVFDTLVSHEDRNKKKNFTDAEVKEILGGLKKGLDFDAKRVMLFYDNLKNSPVKHLDIHPRNIMKDDAGNFKLIDFDRAQLTGDK